MSDLDILRILALVAIHYPILVQMGYTSKLPFALVLPESNYIGEVMERLGTVGLITDSMSDVEVEHTLKTASISPIVYLAANGVNLSKRSATRIAQMIDTVRCGKYRGAEMHTLLVFAFARRIPESISSEFLTIHLNGEGLVNDSEHKLDAAQIEGTSLNKRVLEDVLYPYKKDDVSLRMMNAAIAISGLCFPTIELDPLFTTARKIYEFAEDDQDAGDVCSLFRENIYKYVSESDDYLICKLPDVDDHNETAIKKGIFYDCKYVYLSEALFKEITKDLRTIFSVDVIKEELLDHGILIGGKDRYSTKMTYITHTPERVTKRARMLRFSREQINPIGKLDIVELCKERMGGEKNV